MKQSSTSISDFHDEVQRGERFEFGENWRQFLNGLTDSQVDRATQSVKDLLQVETLQGKTFLDIGSGSGLFSLAAHRLGARVTSFDFDPTSVACTQTIKETYARTSDQWRIMRGSVLDEAFVGTLGQFDIVYSWGVLHHTGAMYKAIDNAMQRVAPGGLFVIAIYNDQGAWSRRWTKIKKLYCSGPVGKNLVSWIYMPYQVVRGFAADLVWMRNPIARYRDYSENRGMSVHRDWLDWLGGYPFEYAKPEEIFQFGRSRGFDLVDLKTAGGSVGCNEFVFRARLERTLALPAKTSPTDADPVT